MGGLTPVDSYSSNIYLTFMLKNFFVLFIIFFVLSCNNKRDNVL